MRLALLLATVLLLSVGVCVAEDTTASPAEAWLPQPVPRDVPDYIGHPSAEPLRPVRKTLPTRITPPPGVNVPVPPPQPPPPPEPRFAPTAPPALTLAYPAPGTPLNEGGATIVWNTGGPIAYVRLYYAGENCRLGGRSRGAFNETIAKVSNKGVYQWNVPYMDTYQFTLRLVGYGTDGKQLAATEADYQLRPKSLLDKPATCIVVSKARQRLWYLKDGLVKRMHIVSTAAGGFTTPNMKPGSYDRKRGAMGRVFSKSYAPRSRMYDVVMYYWLQITSSGSHGIHSTSPGYYSRLGGPASHGCIRQHRADARILYDLVSVGTPVYVR